MALEIRLGEIELDMHHITVVLCRAAHTDTAVKTPVVFGKQMDVYCPKCKVQYTRRMTAPEKRIYT